MGFASVEQFTSPKRGVHSRSKASRRPASSLHRAALLQKLKDQALRCRTPQQFRALLTHLRLFIPYQKFGGTWGYPSRASIRFIFNDGIPLDVWRWYLASGSQWVNPIFQEWLRTNRAYLWCDAAKRLKVKEQFPELVERITQAGLQYGLVGGRVGPDYYVQFTSAMPSERSGRAHLKLFELIVPWLVQASQQAYPRALLTRRETVILERRAMGEIGKQIAVAEGISERTVREHLQRIKKKLYTNDLVNAVVIAVKAGMLLPPSRAKLPNAKGRLGRPPHSPLKREPIP